MIGRVQKLFSLTKWHHDNNSGLLKNIEITRSDLVARGWDSMHEVLNWNLIATNIEGHTLREEREKFKTQSLLLYLDMRPWDLAFFGAYEQRGWAYLGELWLYSQNLQEITLKIVEKLIDNNKNSKQMNIKFIVNDNDNL